MGAPRHLVFYNVSHFYWYFIIFCEKSILLHPNPFFPMTFDYVGGLWAPGGLVFYNVSHFYWYFIIFYGRRRNPTTDEIEPYLDAPPIVESKPKAAGRK